LLHLHQVLARFSCATSVCTIGAEKYSNGISVDNKARFVHVLT